MKTNFYWAGMEYHWVDGVGFELKRSSFFLPSTNNACVYLYGYWSGDYEK